jgi:predicted Zn-ribbon and HTH transcriptional regulator
MARIPITVMGYRCERCNHEWVPNGEKEPKVCPKCHSPYWNSPRKMAPPITYEAFRDKIRDTLKGATGPLTWTEIRTIAKLPQAFPNNVWVRLMEKDIQLKRNKDTHGIIKWSLG